MRLTRFYVCASVILVDFAWAALPESGWNLKVRTALPTQSGQFQIVSAGEGTQLRLDGRLLRELDTSSVLAADQWPADAPAQFVLLDIPAGGRACPDLFRLLDATPGRKPNLTAGFGNCNGSPTMNVDGDEVRIDFPPFNGGKPLTWRYDARTRRLEDPTGGAVTGPLF